MKYNIWYKAPAGIWVNACERENKKEADKELKKFRQEGKETKLVPQNESSQD